MSIWLLIAIGIAVFLLYTLYTLLINVSLIKGQVKVNELKTIPTKEFDEMGDKVFYDGWLFISNAQSSRGYEKVILVREFAICMNGTSFGVYKYDGTSLSEVARATDNFPLNKWVYFAVRYSDNTLEIYLNGKLVKTTYFQNETSLIHTSQKKGQDLKIGGLTTSNTNIYGYITKLRRLTDPPDSNYIWQHYLEGNGQLSGLLGNLFKDRYGITVSVYNDSKQKTRELSIL